MFDDYRIVRSCRRSLGLEITPEACVIIRAPQRLSLRFIQDTISRKRAWIEKKRQMIRQQYPPAVEKQFVQGERFLYLGREYPLMIGNDATMPVIFDGTSFVLSDTCVHRAKNVFMDWYIQQARNVIFERVHFYAPIIGVRHNRIRLTGARKRWGSCNAKGNLTFSWRLVLAPMSVVDYLVVHELSHLKELNHSRRFWEKVSNVLPNYREIRSWLRKHHHRLSF